MSVNFDEKNGLYVFNCPHCGMGVEVEKNQVNCCIFRHGAFFSKTPEGVIIPTTQMNPHTPKEECDRLFSEGLIVGCGRPFRLVPKGVEYEVQVCDYIWKFGKFLEQGKWTFRTKNFLKKTQDIFRSVENWEWYQFDEKNFYENVNKSFPYTKKLPSWNLCSEACVNGRWSFHWPTNREMILFNLEKDPGLDDMAKTRWIQDRAPLEELRRLTREHPLVKKAVDHYMRINLVCPLRNMIRKITRNFFQQKFFPDLTWKILQRKVYFWWESCKNFSPEISLQSFTTIHLMGTPSMDRRGMLEELFSHSDIINEKKCEKIS